MIIPVRCMTCGKVLGDKWVYYQKRVMEMKDSGDIKDDDARQDVVKTEGKKEARGVILDELGLDRMCCRRHLLAHTDLIDVI
jgi:DNA-directed RNA polymerase subunit N (RpoN/RPB10)